MRKPLILGKGANGSEARRPRRNALWTLVRTASASFRRHIPLVVLGLVLGMTVTRSGPALSVPPSADGVVAVSTFGSALTIQRPGSTTEGDVLVASVAARLSGTDSITPPSGWSLVRRDSNAPQYHSLTQALYYKVAEAAEPTSYTWTLASTVSAAGAILNVEGVDVSTPVDSHSGAFTPTSTSFVAPSVTTTTADDLVIAFFAMTSSRSIRQANSELFDVRWQSRTWVLASEGASFVQSTAGATGNVMATARGAPSSAIHRHRHRPRRLHRRRLLLRLYHLRLHRHCLHHRRRRLHRHRPRHCLRRHRLHHHRRRHHRVMAASFRRACANRPARRSTSRPRVWTRTRAPSRAPGARSRRR